MISRRPANALSTVPPPSALPSVHMSGVAEVAWAQLGPVPERISSKISTMPASRVSCRAASR
jgi:hypothetical protein